MNNKIKKIINKKNKSRIVCLTAYSKNMAEEIDKYVDISLVGDSLGSVLYNYNTTRKVTLTNMIDHSKSVRLGVKKSLMVVDMPYKTYSSKSLALKNAKKIIKETKCDAVKLEGGKKIIEQIKFLIKNKIPVMGHLGLLPQTNKGKFKSKGGSAKEKKQLIKDSLLLQKCGVFSIVLECVKTSIAKEITKNLKPSKRGELEITDVIKSYLRNDTLSVFKLPRGTAWLDAGTSSSLYDSSAYVQAIEKRQGIKIGCPEEATYKQGNINKTQLRKLIKNIPSCEYKNYLSTIIINSAHILIQSGAISLKSVIQS